MKVPSLKIGESICHKQYSGQASPASFAQALEEANTFKNPVVTAADRDLLPLGVISSAQPTVSDVLINNRQFSSATWDIIYSEKNARKNYARMQPGTRVFIDRQTRELIWAAGDGAADSRPAQEDVQAPKPQGREAASGGSNPAGWLPAVLPADSGGETGGEKISLGRLDRENTMVAQLLLRNPQYGREAWRILQADSNRGKDFTAILRGQEIFIDPRTLEVSWQGSAPRQMAEAPEEAAAVAAAAEEFSGAAEDPSDPLSSNLVQAVESYLGRSYREMNCYGLLVRGLSRMGIKYGGRGGLQDQLVQMAKSKGLPANAYMTGEGLVEASGAKVFTKSLTTVGNVEKAAGAIYNEMAPFLQKGYILSFSTPTRGHTGVISQHDQTWTFINSGYLDNQVEKTGKGKGVGEEVLAKEIKNWCKVAARNGESLVVTLGRLQEDKLRTAQNQYMPSLQKVL